MAWQCEVCTYINEHDHLDVCGVCLEPRRAPHDFPDVRDLCYELETSGYNIPSSQTLEAASHTSYAFSSLKHPESSHSPNDDSSPSLANEVRIVFLGRTGSGKSASGNNILSKNAFESSVSGSSITRKCQLGWAHRFGRNIQIIDTPGLFDTSMSNAEITQEVVKCVGMSAPGPHAFVLVVRIDRFTEEERATVDHFQQVFGKDMLKHLAVLFTRKDDLKHENKSIHEYVQRVPQDLKQLLKSCNHHYVAFDNRAGVADRDRDVRDLLQLVDKMVRENCGRYYTNEMYEEAEKAIRRREKELKQKHQEQIEKEQQKIRTECERKLKSMQRKQLDLENQLQERIREIERQQQTTSEEEMITLRGDLKDLKAVILEMKENEKEEKVKMEKQLSQDLQKTTEQLQDNQPDFRHEAREEVRKEDSTMMNILNKGLKCLVEVCISAVTPVLAQGAKKLVAKGLTKLIGK